MRFAVLSSGSKANCTFVEAGNRRILIDCGLSAKQTELRLQSIGIDPSTIQAIVVTHEHSDHVAGLEVFARRHGCLVYGTSGTRGWLAEEGFWKRAEPAWNVISAEHPFNLGPLEVSAFAISHDALEPVGYRLSFEGLHLVQCTDLGMVTEGVRRALQGAHALVLESNHDEDLLRACEYPWVVKERILSSQGHLSNHEAGRALKESLHGDLLHVVLGHLSENSNRPDVARLTVDSYLPYERPFSLFCAGTTTSTPLWAIGDPLLRSEVPTAA